MRFDVIRWHVSAGAALVLASACGGPPSKQTIQKMITSSPKFQAPLLAYVPSRITLIPRAVGLPNGGETVAGYNPYFRTLDVDQNNVAKISPPLAVLWAAGVVDVADAATVRTMTTAPATPAKEAVDEDGRSYVVERAKSASTFDAVGHILTVRRLGEASADWVKDDKGPPTPPNQWYRESTTPGWVVTVARRRFVRIDTILDQNSINEHVDPGELLVQFTYTWDPTPAGEPFVPGTDAYDELPESLRYISVFDGGPLRSREQAAHLVLRPDGLGWKVARMGRDWRDAGGVNGPM